MEMSCPMCRGDRLGRPYNPSHYVAINVKPY